LPRSRVVGGRGGLDEPCSNARQSLLGRQALEKHLILQRRYQVHQGHVQTAHPEGLWAHGSPRLGPSPPRPHPGPHQLIIHSPAHRGANGAAVPSDEDEQDGHFFFNHPERGGATSPPRRAKLLLPLFRSSPSLKSTSYICDDRLREYELGREEGAGGCARE